MESQYHLPTEVNHKNEYNGNKNNVNQVLEENIARQRLSLRPDISL